MDQEWNEDELLAFIVEAGRHTYADPDAKKLAAPIRPGCEEYLYEQGDWKYHDSYAWSKDGGGEEIVYFKGTPVWVMNYYGYLIGDVDSKAIYGFLHEALQERHPALPVRGAPLEREGFRYAIEFDRGDIGKFRGVERIYQEGALVYECSVHGGLVR
ncbi:MAG TPA: DUF5680 domain-containing protein [Candidatus Paceibacterota bacterium]|nr:DUF5680 domain-containing protein [Candidatus Paceibacterota bacterium]